MLVDHFSECTLDQKKRELQKLKICHLQLEMGNKANYTNDFGTGHVIFQPANADRLGAIIANLQDDVDRASGVTRANRRGPIVTAIGGY